MESEVTPEKLDLGTKSHSSKLCSLVKAHVYLFLGSQQYTYPHVSCKARFSQDCPSLTNWIQNPLSLFIFQETSKPNTKDSTENKNNKRAHIPRLSTITISTRSQKDFCILPNMKTNNPPGISIEFHRDKAIGCRLSKATRVERKRNDNCLFDAFAGFRRTYSVEH